MLVLSRKRGETIVIGDGITVTVLAVDGDRVKLGVVCPCGSVSPSAGGLPTNRKPLLLGVRRRTAILSL